MPDTKSRSRKKPKILLYTLIATAIILIAGTISVAPFVFSRNSKTVTIRIPENATPEEVKDTLYKYLDHTFADRVLFMANAHAHDFYNRHGAYEIPKGMSPFRAMRRLTRGAQTPVRITVNHFRDLETLAEGISCKTDFTAEDFMKAATDSATLASYGLTPSQALALFLEDTYEIYWSWTPQQVVKKFGDNYKTMWTGINKDKANVLFMKPSDIMIIASITDEETNKNREKGRIGQLYINRLRRGMKLQADPTVRYAVGNFSIQRVTKDHLLTESPYNTYRVEGLPPGPIRTTSKRTVEAILNHPHTTDIFMCAREDFSGYHNFSSDYAEHMQNALRYQKALDERGIK